MTAVWGVTMVRDEADVIAGTVRHLADEGVDGIVVADNRSADDTLAILKDLEVELPCQLVILHDDETAYYQSEKMSSLAAMAASYGADWVIPFDADELWLGPHQVAEMLRTSPPDDSHRVATVELFNHFPSAIDPAGDDPFETIVWRQPQPAPLPKVAFRWEEGAVIHQGNHGVHLPSGRDAIACTLEIRHFPYRSAEQFERKARNGAEAYAATDMSPEIGAHWRAYGALLDRYGPTALHDVFREHFWALSPVDRGLVYDPAPYRRWRASAL